MINLAAAVRNSDESEQTLVWVNGDQIGVYFLKPGNKRRSEMSLLRVHVQAN